MRRYGQFSILKAPALHCPYHGLSLLSPTVTALADILSTSFASGAVGTRR
jgi:hypothetical protein